ncbi:hypothetical protein C900_05544 [Fulvivirga imtechensis AK7]|uniref:Uncharacterized protein n=1 Tax=Fulvivirga imtechensis AK7 TaxID=1237149 RepID=L8JJA5_9BACT|nr:hypothetical protein C900_05544 [Fulvivirga imtechensis AK7]
MRLALQRKDVSIEVPVPILGHTFWDFNEILHRAGYNIQYFPYYYRQV